MELRAGQHIYLNAITSRSEETQLTYYAMDIWYIESTYHPRIISAFVLGATEAGKFMQGHSLNEVAPHNERVFLYTNMTNLIVFVFRILHHPKAKCKSVKHKPVVITTLIKWPFISTTFQALHKKHYTT